MNARPGPDVAGESRLLLARVRKELDRLRRNEPEQGTARFGGVGKVRRGINHLLCEVAQWLCIEERLDADVELQALAIGARKLKRATAGQAAKLIQHLATRPAARRALVRRICQDVSARGSTIWAVIKLGNVNEHGDEEDPEPRITMPALRQLESLLHDVVRAI
jgi:hypothetical protein